LTVHDRAISRSQVFDDPLRPIATESRVVGGHRLARNLDAYFAVAAV
jgi:hypothetical protein